MGVEARVVIGHLIRVESLVQPADVNHRAGFLLPIAWHGGHLELWRNRRSMRLSLTRYPIDGTYAGDEEPLVAQRHRPTYTAATPRPAEYPDHSTHYPTDPLACAFDRS